MANDRMPRTFEKLVRDRIPHIIAQKGEPVPESREAPVSAPEYGQRLKEKLLEEVEELLNAPTPADAMREIADVRSVLQALATNVYGFSNIDVLFVQQQRDQERGRFERGIVMTFPTPPRSSRRFVLELFTRLGRVAKLEDL